MYKISDYNFLKKQIKFTTKKEIYFKSLALTCAINDQCICFLDNINFMDELEKEIDKIAGLICTKEIAKDLSNRVDTIITDKPKELYFLLHNSIEDDEMFETIIEKGCVISDKAYVAPYNVIIKSGTRIEEFASIKENVEIGNNCFIGCGTVIGSPGYNVFKTNDEYVMAKSRGKVLIGNKVTILSNSTVEKSIYPETPTKIGDNCMIANKVVISHDSQINDKCIITSGSIICGFSKLEDKVYMGVNSAVKHVKKIGKNAKIGMGAYVNFDVNEEETIVGFEPMPLEQAKKIRDHNRSILDYSDKLNK